MKPLVLSPLQTYVYPIMNHDGIKISLQTTYGGEKSKSLPCGFVTNYVYELKKTKKQNKNRRYRIKPTKTLTPKGDNRGLGVSSMSS